MGRTVRQAFDALLSGLPPEEVQKDIAALAVTERAALLCTVCAIRDDVANVCMQTANHIDVVLTAQCVLFAKQGHRCHEPQGQSLLNTANEESPALDGEPSIGQ